jgi:hypothetical protein
MSTLNASDRIHNVNPAYIYQLNVSDVRQNVTTACTESWHVLDDLICNRHMLVTKDLRMKFTPG